MHLEALDAQTVTIDGIAAHFRAGERIHTENSYKYAPSEFVAMLQRAGFAHVRVLAGRRTAISPCTTRPPTASADGGAPFFRFRIALTRAQAAR